MRPLGFLVSRRFCVADPSNMSLGPGIEDANLLEQPLNTHTHTHTNTMLCVKLQLVADASP